MLTLSRIVLVCDLNSEGQLSQISIEDRGSALGWEPPLDVIFTRGSYFHAPRADFNLLRPNAG